MLHYSYLLRCGLRMNLDLAAPYSATNIVETAHRITLYKMMNTQIWGFIHANEELICDCEESLEKTSFPILLGIERVKRLWSAMSEANVKSCSVSRITRLTGCYC